MRGKTPLLKTSGQIQSIHAISALSDKGDFWYHLCPGRFDTDKFIDCLEGFMKQRKRLVFLIIDGRLVHKGKMVKDCVESLEGHLLLYVLSACAQELNPDELVWCQMEHVGTTKRPWE